jgi:acetaldehyde dehydrogenase / alcohol dehydrogenase
VTAMWTTTGATDAVPWLRASSPDSGREREEWIPSEREEDLQIRAAAVAQQAFGDWPERRVDGLLQGLAEVIVEHARDLARRTVLETGMGCEDDKAAKNTFAALGVLRSIQAQTACGVLRWDTRSGITEMAVPVGVVLGMMPVTNPVATTVFSALIALKAGNALLVRAHPRAAHVTATTVALMRTALAACGAPADLVQALQPVDRAQVRRLFRHRGVDLVLATGSTGLVAEAMSSGKPTLGAGTGNAPAWICDDADVQLAAQSIVDSKSFDHGIICGSEQHAIVSVGIRRRVVAALERAGAAVLSPADVTQLEMVLFKDGRPRPQLMGRSPGVLVEQAALHCRSDARLLVAPLPDTPASLWRIGRLAPVLALCAVPGEADAVALCRQILAGEGAGHTAAIHTRSRAKALSFARSVPTSRVIVNGPASQGCIGLGNAITPSFALACGAAGGSTTTDNITFRHLTQVIRLAEPRAPAAEPRSMPTAGEAR